MRRIRFRAKDANDGTWVYGDLHLMCDRPHIHTEHTCYPYAGKRAWINENTIGQSTGLLDKNEKEIYEGDVVKYLGMYCYIAFLPQECGFVIVLPKTDTLLGNQVTRIRGSYELGKREDIKIVGNIYDNWDLIEQDRKKNG